MYSNIPCLSVITYEVPEQHFSAVSKSATLAFALERKYERCNSAIYSKYTGGERGAGGRKERERKRKA